MTAQGKKDFWNNWDFKTILQIAIIIAGFIVAYTKLEAQVFSNRELYVKDIEYMKEDMRDIKDQLKELTEEIKKINLKSN